MLTPASAKIKFTISVSPELSRDGLAILTADKTVQRFQELAPHIYDINFTCHIPPFTRDAHGVFINDVENRQHLLQMLRLQDLTGIRITPVFNDIYAPNTRENLDVFIRNFSPLYEQGIKNVSIPHVIWMKWGDLQRRFPDAVFKNTVLRRVRSGQDFWNHAEAGYHYINLDQTLVRNFKMLKEIKKAQEKFRALTGRPVVTALLHGEGCLGYCPLWDEHYQHTLTHPQLDLNIKNSIDYFREPQHLSCLAVGDAEARALRTVGLPIFLEDLEEICGYFDVIKLPGRKAFQSLADCLNAVANFYQLEGELLATASDYIKKLYQGNEHQRALVQRWRHTIKNCQFQCWDCQVCSDLIAEAIL